MRWALAAAILGTLVLLSTCAPPFRSFFGSEWPPSASVMLRATWTPSAEPTVAIHLPPPPSPSYGLPKRLRIPKLRVDAPIEQVGIGKDGAMVSPRGPGIAGWYKLGTRPGERGSAVIAGHSGYRGGRAAIFDHLKDLASGDTIVIDDDQGASISFVVREGRLFDPAADTQEVFARTDGRYLNLVTCTGAWSERAGTHTQRLVVFSVAAP